MDKKENDLPTNDTLDDIQGNENRDFVPKLKKSNKRPFNIEPMQVNQFIIN